MTYPTRRTLRAPAVGACLGLLAALVACGNGSDQGKADVSAPVSASSSSSTSTDPRATPALRTACVSTNDDIASANEAWNRAVDSHKSNDLAKATATMSKLSGSLRSAGKDANDAAFSTKAEAVAKQVDSIVKAQKPSKTVDTTTYNDDVDALTSYCSSVFPKPSTDASGAVTPDASSPGASPSGGASEPSASGASSSSAPAATSPASATGSSSSSPGGASSR